MSEWASDRFTIDVECEEWAKALPYIISYQCSYQLYIVHYTQGTTVYILNFTRGLGGKKMKLYMCSCTCLKIWLCIGIALLTGGAVMLYVKYRPRITKKQIITAPLCSSLNNVAISFNTIFFYIILILVGFNNFLLYSNWYCK